MIGRSSADGCSRAGSPWLAGGLAAILVTAACAGKEASPGAGAETGGASASGGSTAGGTGGTVGASTTGGASTAEGTGGASTTGGASNPPSKPEGGSSGGAAGIDSGVPAALSSFASGVRAASDQAMMIYPNVCASAVPAVRVDSSEDVARAVTEYLSASIGVPVADIQVEPQACGDPSRADCANLFLHDVTQFGGPLPQALLPLARRIEQEATDVVVLALIPTKNGMRIGSHVIIAGIRDGWLMAVTTFSDPGICQVG